MVGVLEKVVRRCLFVCGDVVEEMVRRCRGWCCGGDGVVVEMRLFQNKDSKRIILPQRSQPGYTNNCPLDIGGEI